MSVDWGAVLLGFSVGVPVSLLYFVGLAWGMRRALSCKQPSACLLMSFACRITVLLTIGYWVASSGANNWPLAGFALAFLLLRLAVLFWAKATCGPALPKQEGV